MPSSRLEIDLSAVDRNLGTVRSVVAGGAPEPGAGPGAPRRGRTRVQVCCVLKQDAYGAGAARVGKRLTAAGADMFAVYSLDEARALADAVAGVPIMVLMPVPGVDRMDPLYRHVASGRLHLSLHSPEQLAQINDMGVRLGATVPVHVQIDTGMSRGGVTPSVARGLVERVINCPRVRLAGMMTHFSAPCCDPEFTREQARLFRDFIERIRPMLRAAVAAGQRAVSGIGGGSDVLVHAANTCATFRSRSYHGSMVRVGQALLGFALDDELRAVAEAGGTETGFEFAREALSLEPALRWTSSVVHLSEIPPGWPVGYGSAWRAPERTDGKKSRIALVPVGYADGYPRALGGGPGGGPGWVGFTGRLWERRGGAESDEPPRDEHGAPKTVYAPVVGRVSMDQITVDVTDVPEHYLAPPGCGPAAGAEVELYGRERGGPNYIPWMATAARSITHELLCRVSHRVERVYRYPAAAAGEPSAAPVKVSVPPAEPAPATPGIRAAIAVR